MTLPDIPDAAFKAGYAVALNLQSAEDAITAAWPHLYAAALRHAADMRWPLPDGFGPKFEALITPVLNDSQRDLFRRMADEATPTQRASAPTDTEEQE